MCFYLPQGSSNICVSDHCQASSAYKHSLKEVLALPAIASKIKDTKAAREVAALQDFYAMLGADSSRAFYGPGHVLAAADMGAIQTLLISGEHASLTLRGGLPDKSTCQ